MELDLGTIGAEMWKVLVRCICHSHTYTMLSRAAARSSASQKEKILKNEAVHIPQVYFPPLLTIKDLDNSQMPEAAYSRDDLPN